MEPLAITGASFPVGQYLAVGANTADRGGFPMPELPIFISGSQWVRYLPDQGDGSDGAAGNRFGASVSRRAIFLPSEPDAIRGISGAGAYLYQLEANGSATYLTKVTAPMGL